jgi:hypothetical protein
MRARRSIAGGVEDVEGLLSLGGDNADRVVVSAAAARSMSPTSWFGSEPGQCWKHLLGSLLSDIR